VIAALPYGDPARKRMVDIRTAPQPSWSLGMGDRGPRSFKESSVRVRLFGPLLLEAGSHHLGARDFERLKSKQILEILVAARGHPVPKNQLAQELWADERPPRNELATIETYVSSLRSDLEAIQHRGKSLVVTEQGAYRFAVEHADVDLDRFEELRDAASSAELRAARSLLKEAIDLVAGEILEDEPNSGWAHELRVRYHREVEDVFLAAAELALRDGEYPDGLNLARHVLSTEPLAERACRIVMVASYALGHQREAVDAFQRCREMLRDDLGLDPTPETTALYRGILQQMDPRALVAGMTGSAVLPADEKERLAAVRRYDVLDTPPDGAFDRVAALAARFFMVPVATVTIVDEDRIWFKARHGIEIDEVGRDPGLCASAILQHEPYVVSNAPEDARAMTNPLVRGQLGLQFYAGAPVTTRDGFNLGTVNVMGKEPREVTEVELETLRDLAAIVVDELELRLAARRAVRTRDTSTAED
jgi:DNA-binding SARP family transcriptional activator